MTNESNTSIQRETRNDKRNYHLLAWVWSAATLHGRLLRPTRALVVNVIRNLENSSRSIEFESAL